MGITEDILNANGGDRVKAAAVLAHGLMIGDRASFKQGYSRINALLAAQEMYDIGAVQMPTVDDLLEQRLVVRPVEFGPGTDMRWSEWIAKGGR